MYKLYRSKRTWKLHRQISIGGAIHNHLIALHRRYYRLYKRYPSIYQIRAHLAKLKRLPKYAWWKQLGSQAVQQIANRIDAAYQRFFQNLKDRQAGKTTRKVSPPTFRKIAKAKSFTLTQAGWKLLGGNRLRIGTITYKFAKSREIQGTIKTVTIKRDTLGDLYVYFSCVVDPEPISRVMTGKSAGFDFGLTTYLTGKVAPPPATASAERPSLTGRVPCHCVGRGRPSLRRHSRAEAMAPKNRLHNRSSVRC